jgi:hypothetical protein
MPPKRPRISTATAGTVRRDEIDGPSCAHNAKWASEQVTNPILRAFADSVNTHSHCSYLTASANRATIGMTSCPVVWIPIWCLGSAMLPSTRKMSVSLLSPEELKALSEVDSPTISNAVEAFGVRDPTSGYASTELRHLYPDSGAMVGYALAFTSSPPVSWFRTVLQQFSKQA